MVEWDELADRMEASIDRDPNVLLETNGGPVGRTADLILARLYERDGQVVRELCLRRVEPFVDIPTPLPERLLHQAGPDDVAPMIRRARFVLQSSFATYTVSPPMTPMGIIAKPPTFQVSVLFVRYRRR